MKNLRLVVLPLVLLMALFSVPRLVLADEYDESQSHPLRIMAYITHPFGLLLEWVAARPFHHLVSNDPDLEFFFGHGPHPPMFAERRSYDFGVSKGAAMRVTAPPRRPAPQEPVAERVTVKVQEVLVEKTVFKEVPKIVEVERVIFPDIAFRFDSAQLTDLGKGKAYLVAQKLKEKSDIVVVVEGHADYVGADEYNQKLGLRRAEAVMKELAELGIAAGRMSGASLGESKPLIDQQTDWARAVNRRVEFRVKAP